MRNCNRKPRDLILYGGTIERINAGIDPGDGIEFSLDSKQKEIFVNQVIDFDYRADLAKIKTTDIERVVNWFIAVEKWIERARR